MNDKKRKWIGVLLIAIGIAVAGLFIYKQFFAEEHTYTVKIETETDETEEGIKEEKIIPFELKNLSEEILDMLQTDEQELAEMLQEWTAVNGEYKSAVGVEFYEIDKSLCTPEKSSIMMKTIVGEGHREEERRILILDYYKELDQYNIHP